MKATKQEQARKKHEWYIKHKQEQTQKKHEWYVKHREQVMEYNHKYRKEHPEQRDKMRQYFQRYYSEHREIELERAYRWYQKNKERALQNNRKYRRENATAIKVRSRELNKRLRQEIITLLGRKCVHCDYSTDARALQIDHVNGGGNQHKKRLNCDTLQYYRTILREIQNGSKDYQLLCANCNWIKMDEENERHTIPLFSLGEKTNERGTL